ncbi:M23 family metallopeptidase [candidate division CSSED10-310 bacterium]|uniref:M23 family metallopeptidase n=1 Tax=candidate division CSSED10-310 bacterium TaxID=2855610 RepID=A0ABV6YRM3_UNCC1
MVSKEKRHKMLFWLKILVCFIAVIFVSSILFLRLESKNPNIGLKLDSTILGKVQEIEITVSDIRSGIRKIQIVLTQEGKKSFLLEKDYPAQGLLRISAMKKARFKIKLEPSEHGISDGKAVLSIVASDYSWRRWGQGNQVALERQVLFDTQPPEVVVISRQHNVNQGGAGLVIYTLSETCPSNGVRVGENFFPGYAGYFEDTNIFLAFFGLTHEQGPGTSLSVQATDQAGNSVQAGFYHHINKRRFRKDNINLSDNFLKMKMPEFDNLLRLDPAVPVIERFLKVNKDLRHSNYEDIMAITRHTDAKLYWRGEFMRFPNSANRAGYADYRTYKYKGREIDHQTHLGIDLASLAHSPVPAANNGRIAFAGSIGIYGKTVLIDHGFGLFSMYSHLNSFQVQKDQMVNTGDTIGNSGSTGLAGGDHLHFSIIIQNIFVNPKEWWDPAWIKNNISAKIESVKNSWNE